MKPRPGPEEPDWPGACGGQAARGPGIGAGLHTRTGRAVVARPANGPRYATERGACGASLQRYCACAMLTCCPFAWLVHVNGPVRATWRAMTPTCAVTPHTCAATPAATPTPTLLLLRIVLLFATSTTCTLTRPPPTTTAGAACAPAGTASAPATASVATSFPRMVGALLGLGHAIA